MTGEPLAPTGTLTVLVIDDEPQIRRLVSNALAADALLGADAQSVGVLRVAAHESYAAPSHTLSRPRPRQSLTDAPPNA